MTFDSTQYEWSDLTLILGGKVITGIRSVSYEVGKEKELLYGKGNEPIAIQSGNKSYSGKIKVLTGELNTLVKAGGGSLLDLQLDAVVCYGNPSQGDVMRTDKIFGIQFTEGPVDWNQGDKFAEHELDILFLRVIKD